jgi:hypothetical protein
MSEKNKVLSRKNLPTGIPLFQTITILIVIDHWNLSDLWRGINYVAIGLLWLAYAVSVFKDEGVDIFEDKK